MAAEAVIEPGAGIIVLQCFSLGLFIIVGGVGNAIVIYTFVRRGNLYRPPYYYVLNLAVLDVARSLLCFPFVMSTAIHHMHWKYGDEVCKLLAFANTFCLFGSIISIFIIAVDRYTAVVHSQYHSRRFKGAICIAIVLIGWGAAFLFAFPPVFGLGTYSYRPLEAQCTFEHRYFKSNDTLGFELILAILLLMTNIIYLRIFLFVRAHRRMRPVMYQPAVSNNWTFYGPGANANNRRNWRASYGPLIQGIPIAVIGQNQQHAQTHRFELQPVKNEKITRVCFAVNLAFMIAWVPHLIVSFWYTFDLSQNVPHGLVTIAAWWSFMAVIANPVIYVFMCPRFRRALNLIRLNRRQDRVDDPDPEPQSEDQEQ